jgi:RNase P subunit RPR2
MRAKLERLKRQAMSVKDKRHFAKSNKTYDRAFCFGCSVALMDATKLKQHTRGKGNSTDCTESTHHEKVKCLEFKWGRFFPVNQNGASSRNHSTSLPLPVANVRNGHSNTSTRERTGGKRKRTVVL